ncbi:MAG: AbrB/MazE/SpoVT family DNA-binding domain-containing protein [Dethiobacteria bacterium]|nr:AbrB/MazE/SpoVT family DNA-binding domain-containing protein [Bacillota bacterium]
MANYAKVSSKGQITLPASIRKYLNAEPGTTLEIVREGEGIYITAVKGDISALQGTVIAQMFAAGRQEIYSYDRDFDKVDGITPLTPDNW